MTKFNRLVAFVLVIVMTVTSLPQIVVGGNYIALYGGSVQYEWEDIWEVDSDNTSGSDSNLDVPADVDMPSSDGVADDDTAVGEDVPADEETPTGDGVPEDDDIVADADTDDTVEDDSTTDDSTLGEYATDDSETDDENAVDDDNYEYDYGYDYDNDYENDYEEEYEYEDEEEEEDLLVNLLPPSIFENTIQGDGTEYSPFIIYDIDDFQYVREALQSGGLINDTVPAQTAAFALAGDIDISNDFTFFGLGSLAFPFMGSFDGNNFTINLNINSGSSDVGLFRVADGAAISNLLVTGSVIGRSNVGGIVGTARNGTVISGVESSVDVRVIDWNWNMYLHWNTGGIAGQISNGKIISSSVEGNVIGIRCAIPSLLDSKQT